MGGHVHGFCIVVNKKMATLSYILKNFLILLPFLGLKILKILVFITYYKFYYLENLVTYLWFFGEFLYRLVPFGIKIIKNIASKLGVERL